MEAARNELAQRNYTCVDFTHDQLTRLQHCNPLMRFLHKYVCATVGCLHDYNGFLEYHAVPKWEDAPTCLRECPTCSSPFHQRADCIRVLFDRSAFAYPPEMRWLSEHHDGKTVHASPACPWAPYVRREYRSTTNDFEIVSEGEGVPCGICFPRYA